LIEEGLSVNEIAKILQINYTTVYAKMSEFWSKTSIIALRQQFDVEKPTRRRHVNKEALKEFLLKDFTIGEIASSFGVGKSTIYKRIKEYWGDRYHLDE
jgi:transposase